MVCNRCCENRRIVATGDGQRQDGGGVGDAITGGIAEDIIDGFTLPQTLHSIAAVVQRIDVAAVGIESQCAIRTDVGARCSHLKRGSCIDIAVVRQHIASGSHHAVFAQRSRIGLDDRRIVAAGDGQRQDRGGAGDPIAGGVAENVIYSFTFKQGLHRRALVVQRIRIAAVGIEYQGAILACIGTGCSHLEGSACIDIAVVRQYISRDRHDIIFAQRSCIGLDDRCIVCAYDGDVYHGSGRQAGCACHCITETICHRLPRAQRLIAIPYVKHQVARSIHTYCVTLGRGGIISSNR